MKMNQISRIRTPDLRLVGTWIVMLAALHLLPDSRASGIPEPSQLWYGTVWNQVGNQTVRVTSGQLVWECHPGDGGAPVILTTQLTNINDQFSFMLEVPCETVLPGLTLSVNALEVTIPPRIYAHTNLTLDGQPLFLTPGNLSLFAVERGRLEQIDLSMFRMEIDSDQDGLPDWWEDQYFAGQADPNVDPDGDGMNNLGEYKAGTDPLDDQSLFAFISIDPQAAGGVRIEWASTADRSYTVERSSRLMEGFSPIQTGLASTPPINTYLDTTANGTGPSFYRIQLEP